MTLQPGEYLEIVRDLQNPNISGTFYVRAIIKNAKTLAVLDTVDLTDQGAYLFSGEWLVTGIRAPGQFIVTVIVYTDAGYSVRSEDYGNFTTTYQVRDLTSANNFPVNLIPEGSVDVDYKKIRKILKEEIAIAIKALAPESEEKETDDHLNIALTTLGEKLLTSYSELAKEGREDSEKKHTEIIAAISEKGSSDEEEIDFTPVIKAISNIEEKQDLTLETLQKHKKYIAAIHAGMERIHGVVTTLDQTMGNMSNLLRSLFDKVQGFMKASEEVKAMFGQVKNFSTVWKKALSEISPEEKSEEVKEEKS